MTEPMSLELGPVVHESAEVTFHVVDGEVAAYHKNQGRKLPPETISNLLLLDIAMFLADIRNYGIAQHADYGQATWVKS